MTVAARAVGRRQGTSKATARRGRRGGRLAQRDSMRPMQTDRVTCRECGNQQQRHQYPMAAPGSGLQISAELRQPVAGPLELRSRPVPFARPVFDLVVDALGDALGFAQSGMHLGDGALCGRGLSRRALGTGQLHAGGPWVGGAANSAGAGTTTGKSGTRGTSGSTRTGGVVGATPVVDRPSSH